jgi:hypothetical protein
LPPPKKAENELKKLAITSIKKWHDNYGKDYKMLAMGFNYLKNCKKVNFKKFFHVMGKSMPIKQFFFLNLQD